MRAFLVSLVAVSATLLFVQFTRADDDKKTTTVTGILIDQHCGAKMMQKDDPEAAAAKHPKSCAINEDCAASGYAVISGKKMYKFDDAGNKLAKEYFEKNDSTHVGVYGTVSGDDQIAVTAINTAAEK